MLTEIKEMTAPLTTHMHAYTQSVCACECAHACMNTHKLYLSKYYVTMSTACTQIFTAF